MAHIIRFSEKQGWVDLIFCVLTQWVCCHDWEFCGSPRHHCLPMDNRGSLIVSRAKIKRKVFAEQVNTGRGSATRAKLEIDYLRVKMWVFFHWIHQITLYISYQIHCFVRTKNSPMITTSVHVKTDVRQTAIASLTTRGSINWCEADSNRITRSNNHWLKHICSKHTTLIPPFSELTYRIYMYIYIEYTLYHTLWTPCYHKGIDKFVLSSHL